MAISWKNALKNTFPLLVECRATPPVISSAVWSCDACDAFECVAPMSEEMESIFVDCGSTPVLCYMY